jgi:hypothetical protein
VKFEVEVEVLYTYAIEAEDEQGARMIAQMNVDSQAPYLERTIASVYCEKVEPENIATEWVQISRPGFCN